MTYSGGTDRFGELCYKFFISNKLAQIVNFPAQKTDCNYCSLSLLDIFLSSGTSFCCSVCYSSLRISGHVGVSVYN